MEAAPPGSESVKTRKSHAPTSSQLLQDPIFRLGQYYWLDGAKHKGKFNQDLTENVYQKDLLQSGFSIRRCMILEFSQYLENYLIPFYTPQRATKAYVVTMAAIINEKFRENVPAWKAFTDNPQAPSQEIRDENFGNFLRHVQKLLLDEHESFTPTNYLEKRVLLVFLDHLYNSLEEDMIRDKIQHTLLLSMWINLIPGRLKQELSKSERIRKLWKATIKKFQKLPDEQKCERDFDRRFLFNMIKQFLLVVDDLNHQQIKITKVKTGEGFVSDQNLKTQLEIKKAAEDQKVKYCERFLEFVADLEARLTTRRWFNTLLEDTQLVVKCETSALGSSREDGHLLALYSKIENFLKIYSCFKENMNIIKFILLII